MNEKRAAVRFKAGMHEAEIFQHTVTVHNGDESVTIVRSFGKSADNVASAVYNAAKTLTAVAVEICFGAIDKFRHAAVNDDIVAEHKVSSEQLVVVLVSSLGQRTDTHVVLFCLDYKRV